MAISPKYLKGSDGTGSAVLAHITENRIAGATVLKVNNVDNWPPFFIATTGLLNPAGYITEATKKEFRGRLQSGDIIIEAFEPGFSDTGNTDQEVVILKQTTGWSDGVADNLQESITARDELLADSIVPGTGVVTVVSGREVAISNMTYYINGIRFTKAGIPNKTLTATKDTYGYIDTAGAVSWLEVAVDAAAPATPANSIPFVKATTNASAVTATVLMSRGAVSSQNLNLSVTTDANGWKVRDFGSFKRYTKRQWVDAGSFTGGQSKYFSFGSLPVGVVYDVNLEVAIGFTSITSNTSSNTGSNAFTTLMKPHISTSASNAISIVMTNAYNNTTDVGSFAVFITITKDN